MTEPSSPDTDRTPPGMPPPSGVPSPTRPLSEAIRVVRDTWTVQTVATLGLFVLAWIYTLHIARGLFLPIVLAILVSVLLFPLVAKVERIAPRGVAAGLVMAAFVLALGVAIAVSAEPAREWFQDLPANLERVEAKTRDWLQPVSRVREAAEQVEKMTETGEQQANAKIQVSGRKPLADTVVQVTRKFFAGMAIFIGLLYFLLATGDLFLRKMVRILPSLSDKKRAVNIAHGITRDVSRHLITITVVNAGLGLTLGLALATMGVESPAFWGILAAVLNFVPYLGAVVGICLLSLSSILAADSASWAAAAPPLVYLVLTSLEGTWITPWILGRRLRLNPVVVFLGLLFWGWIWGIIGALLAVPLLIIFKVICDNVPTLVGIGELLGD